MAGELVERLRQAADMRDDLKERYWHRASGLKREAADRIESLERENATLRAALEPFVAMRDALSVQENVKLISKKFDGFAPVSVTVTKAQYLAAAAIRNMGGEE